MPPSTSQTRPSLISAYLDTGHSAQTDKAIIRGVVAIIAHLTKGALNHTIPTEPTTVIRRAASVAMLGKGVAVGVGLPVITDLIAVDDIVPTVRVAAATG